MKNDKKWKGNGHKHFIIMKYRKKKKNLKNEQKLRKK